MDLTKTSDISLSYPNFAHDNYDIYFVCAENLTMCRLSIIPIIQGLNTETELNLDMVDASGFT